MMNGQNQLENLLDLGRSQNEKKMNHEIKKCAVLVMSYWLLYESNDDVLVSLKMSSAQQQSAQGVEIIYEGSI